MREISNFGKRMYMCSLNNDTFGPCRTIKIKYDECN